MKKKITKFSVRSSFFDMEAIKISDYLQKGLQTDIVVLSNGFAVLKNVLVWYFDKYLKFQFKIYFFTNKYWQTKTWIILPPPPNITKELFTPIRLGLIKVWLWGKGKDPHCKGRELSLNQTWRWIALKCQSLKRKNCVPLFSGPKASQ